MALNEFISLHKSMNNASRMAWCEMAMSGADGWALSMQTITGSYTLQPKLQAVVNGFVNLSNTAVANITAAEDLASYENIHPLYLEVRRTLSRNIYERRAC